MCHAVLSVSGLKQHATAPCSLDGWARTAGTKMSQHVVSPCPGAGVRARRSGHRHAGAAPGASFCSTPVMTDAENPVLICRAQSQMSFRGEQQRSCRNQLCGCHRYAAAPVSEKLGVGRMDHELYEVGVADKNYPSRWL